VFFDDLEYPAAMTPAQCRAARGLLNWNQDEVALAARVSVVTVRNFENDKSTPQRATLDVIQRAFEAAGVEFTNGERPGVRLRDAAAAPAGAAGSASKPAAGTTRTAPLGKPRRRRS
jgi:transcriptional regulator with XRE-family HTH domain